MPKLRRSWDPPPRPPRGQGHHLSASLAPCPRAAKAGYIFKKPNCKQLWRCQNSPPSDRAWEEAASGCASSRVACASLATKKDCALARGIWKLVGKLHSTLSWPQTLWTGLKNIYILEAKSWSRKICIGGWKFSPCSYFCRSGGLEPGTWRPLIPSSTSVRQSWCGSWRFSSSVSWAVIYSPPPPWASAGCWSGFSSRPSVPALAQAQLSLSCRWASLRCAGVRAGGECGPGAGAHVGLRTRVQGVWGLGLRGEGSLIDSSFPIFPGCTFEPRKKRKKSWGWGCVLAVSSAGREADWGWGRSPRLEQVVLHPERPSPLRRAVRTPRLAILCGSRDTVAGEDGGTQALGPGRGRRRSPCRPLSWPG